MFQLKIEMSHSKTLRLMIADSTHGEAWRMLRRSLV
jgi:hypothetical protein